MTRQYRDLVPQRKEFLFDAGEEQIGIAARDTGATGTLETVEDTDSEAGTGAMTGALTQNGGPR